MISQILIGVIIGIILGVIGTVAPFLFYLIFLSDERRLEKYYRQTVTNLYGAGLLGVFPKVKPRSIIVEKANKNSRFRRQILRIIYKLRGREVDEITYVFEQDPAKQEAFLIKEAIKNAFLNADLLDTKFVDSLVAYFAFKFITVEAGVSPKTKAILQEEYEKSPERGMVVTLDDPEFSEKVVINPPPEKKSLLTELILPLVLWKSEETKGAKVDFHTKESLKLFFRDIIDGIYKGEIGILYIGLLEPSHYIELFSNAICRFSRGITIAARGSNISHLQLIWRKIIEQAESTWAMKFLTTDIQGKWDFGKGAVESYWKIVRYSPIETKLEKSNQT